MTDKHNIKGKKKTNINVKFIHLNMPECFNINTYNTISGEKMNFSLVRMTSIFHKIWLYTQTACVAVDKWHIETKCNVSADNIDFYF